MLFDFNNAACQNLRSLHESVTTMRRFNDKVGQWFFMLLTSFTLPAAAADDASLQISVEGGAFNAKFKSKFGAIIKKTPEPTPVETKKPVNDIEMNSIK